LIPCAADAVTSQQDFAEQLKVLTQQSELALNARPAADQYNQVGCSFHHAFWFLNIVVASIDCLHGSNTM